MVPLFAINTLRAGTFVVPALNMHNLFLKKDYVKVVVIVYVILAV